MGKLLITVLGMAGLAACSGGGGGTGNSGGGTGSAQLDGTLQLLGHEPEDGAVQVPLAQEPLLRFDGRVVLDCFTDPDSWLRIEGSEENVAGSFHLAESGRAAVFSPSAPLLAETDYVLQLSPLTCDDSGRILEEAHQLHFRTLDTTPPVVQSASFTAGQSGVSRTGALQLTFSEAIAGASIGAASVYLRDNFGTTYPATRTLQGAVLQFQPLADLPGDRSFVLAVNTAVTDRAGNRIAQIWSRNFRSAQDLDQPGVISSWPDSGTTGASPLLQPVFQFTESMDPYSVEPSSLLFQDEFGSVVGFRVHASPDQRQLRIEPIAALQQNRRYTVGFLLGPAAACDVSGNTLNTTAAMVFTTGSDQTPPGLDHAQPANGEGRVSINAVPELTFTEPLDSAWVDESTVVLLQDGDETAVVVEPVLGGTAIRVTPVLPLQPAASCHLRVLGGHSGVRDLAGIPLAQDIDVAFTTADDATAPELLMQPPDGAVGVPSGAAAVVLFAQPMDPTTVSADTVQVLDANGSPVDGAVTLTRGNRVARFTPTASWTAGVYYHTVVRAGVAGVREHSGNWLPEDRTAHWRAGSSTDISPPSCDVTINGTDASRRQGLCLPPNGFTIDITASDPTDQSLDMGSLAVQLSGPGTAPTSDQIFAVARIDNHTCHYQVPANVALASGEWTLSVGVGDLSGNRASSAQLQFSVTAPSAAQLPFERTQVVWVRTDLDRDGNGTPDFEDDLLRLGLLATGDPAHTNARMRQLVLDGILTQAYSLISRGPRGEVLGPDSVPLRYTTRQPIALAHMQMSLGGFDPDGGRNRRYGDNSTGVLGRALYDYKNETVNERNTSQSPGLGVFPTEMFLFQARIHLQVYPGFNTMFSQRFLPLCPDMGGTPAGAGSLDATVLAESFDYASATTQQRARYNQVFAAADDWATIIGIILAHEVGHSVGLVAPGDAPTGLFGDASLHDSNASSAEVMAAAVGYEAMLTLAYQFRDVDLAYLRQRLVLR